MTDLFISPRRYIQKGGVIGGAGELILPFGNKPLVLGDELVFSVISDVLSESLKGAGLEPRFEIFCGECCHKEINRLANLAGKENRDMIVGTGGGKALDTAKAVGWYMGLPIITIPTSAATCSAWSNISPVYTEDGVYAQTLNLERNPDLVLVNPEIIAKAPARLLSAGMGDALAKWYEARVTVETPERDVSTRIALNLSKTGCEIVASHGAKAREDVEKDLCSKEVEEIIETNILLTGLIGGLGGKRCRSAAAHAINYAMTTLKETHNTLHGEMVSFGVIVQFILERRDEEEIGDLMKLYSTLNLPLTFEEVGLADIGEERLRKAVRVICKNGSRVHNLPLPVNEAMVYDALLEADKRGREFKKGIQITK